MNDVLQKKPAEVVSDTVKRVGSPIAPTRDFEAVIPTILSTLQAGLGSATDSRKMSLNELLGNPAILAATMMDPYFRRHKSVRCASPDQLAAARKWIFDKAMKHATGPVIFCFLP